ncbi:MAG: hypothetical protein VBE63_08420 [Lamprobacter sp.]|uniref:hypothetical protein n=1 Tax=Lamprobacter sp. TaxID=3100796 RepID=UPI002B260C6C|nr:hypothetical protein [Lamprobacter sp.]MEA3639954.1 hypothetical protein [Lamprobacter sp.]
MPYTTYTEKNPPRVGDTVFRADGHHALTSVTEDGRLVLDDLQHSVRPDTVLKYVCDPVRPKVQPGQLLPEANIEHLHISVGELAEAIYPGITIDTARPISWDDAMQARGISTRGRFVWGYTPDDTLSGRPLPLTLEAMLDLAAISVFLP